MAAAVGSMDKQHSKKHRRRSAKTTKRFDSAAPSALKPSTSGGGGDDSQQPNAQKLLGWPSIVDPNAALPKWDAYNDQKSLHQPQHGLTVQYWKSKLVSLGTQAIYNQYLWLTIEKPVDGDNTMSMFFKNAKLNRYSNIGLYDLTRVLLSDNLGNDYIHASYVDGYVQSNAYIITQGPLEHTVVDFWRMVWQERVLIVVMLTGIVERGVDKCAIYFPVANNEDLNLGVFRLSLVDVEMRGNHLLALIKVHCTLTDELHYTLLIMYGNWPDGWVPEPAGDLVNFALLVRQCRASMMKRLMPNWKGHARGPPLLVHCSAGIGRSATFTVLDICLDMLLHLGRVNVAQVTEKVRSQRMGAIQNGWQYLYLHYVILKHAKDLGYVSTTTNTAAAASKAAVPPPPPPPPPLPPTATTTNTPEQSPPREEK